MAWTTRRLIALFAVPFAIVVATVVVATYVLPSVTLTIERPTYRVGETVRFSLHNGRQEPVYLSCPTPWRILREIDGAWQPVEAHGCAQVIVAVESGASRNWSWVSQTMTDRPDLAPVEPGRYRIDISVMTTCGTPAEGCTIVHLTAFFRLE